MQEPQQSDTILVSSQQLPLRLQGVLDEGSDIDKSSGTSLECSPAHTSGTIRQQSTGSRQKDHEDDIIFTSPVGGAQEVEDPDYMNQDAIDEDLSDDSDGMNTPNEDSEDERNCHAGGTRKIIFSQKSDRKGSIDIILSLGGGMGGEMGGGMGGGIEDSSDYMNQDAIDDNMEEEEEEEQRRKDRDSDYINQAAIDNAATELNQETIEESEASVWDTIEYLNEAVIDNAATEQNQEESEASVWDTIEYLNQEIIDQVHQEIEKQQQEAKDDEYMNQAVIDAAYGIGSTGQEPFYDTEDDLTEDDLDDDYDGDRRMKIHSYKEPLQIHGTSPIKSRTLKLASASLDYENQDVLEEVLEGDIIPMTVATGKGQSPDISMDLTQSNWSKSADVAKPPSGGLKTQAEASGGGQVMTVSHDSLNETSEQTRPTRNSLCSTESGTSSLDFACPRLSTAEGGMGERGGADELRLGAEEKSQSLKVAPISTTKLRSNTDARVLADRPPPLSLTTHNSSSCNSLQDTPDSFDFSNGNHFSKEYTPVSPEDC